MNEAGAIRLLFWVKEMTNYRLKNMGLQRKLDEISEGRFSSAMQEVDTLPKIIFVRLGKDVSDPVMTLHLSSLEAESYDKYSPNNWNVWPTTKPPENQHMRVEILKKSSHESTEWWKGFGVWDGARWLFLGYDGSIMDKIVRFRPWED